MAAGFKLPERRQVLLTIGSLRDKTRFLPSARLLRDLGYTLYATRHTSRFLEDQGVPNIRLYKIHERRKPSLLEYISPDRLDLIINIPSGYDRKELTDGYIIRRRATDVGIPLITNLQLAELVVKSLAAKTWNDLKVEPYDHYVGHRASAALPERPRAFGRRVQLREDSMRPEQASGVNGAGGSRERRRGRPRRATGLRPEVQAILA